MYRRCKLTHIGDGSGSETSYGKQSMHDLAVRSADVAAAEDEVKAERQRRPLGGAAAAEAARGKPQRPSFPIGAPLEDREAQAWLRRS
eukprot:9371306-Pyramimonas_sp.AAC.1